MPRARQKTSPRDALRAAVRLLWLACLAPAIGLAAQSPAPQTTSQPEPPPDLMTLHVYTTRLQVAALVLDSKQRPVANLNPSLFRLRLDNGRPFTPTAVHVEHDDPIDLAVVLDLSRPHNYQPDLQPALATLRDGVLLPHDTLTLYAADCSLIAFVGPTDTPAAVEHAVDKLFHDPGLHQAKHPGRTCAGNLHLWDYVGYVLQRSATHRGRHAILLLSDGEDNASKLRTTELGLIAGTGATPIFSLPSSYQLLDDRHPSTLMQIAAFSGAIVLNPPGRDLSRSFTDLVQMLRERYILDLPRPPSIKGGFHPLQASLVTHTFTIHATGTSAPVADEAQMRDASTIRYDNTDGAALHDALAANASGTTSTPRAAGQTATLATAPGEAPSEDTSLFIDAAPPAIPEPGDPHILAILPAPPAGSAARPTVDLNALSPEIRRQLVTPPPSTCVTQAFDGPLGNARYKNQCNEPLHVTVVFGNIDDAQQFDLAPGKTRDLNLSLQDYANRNGSSWYICQRGTAAVDTKGAFLRRPAPAYACRTTTEP